MIDKHRIGPQKAEWGFERQRKMRYCCGGERGRLVGVNRRCTQLLTILDDCAMRFWPAYLSIIPMSCVTLLACFVSLEGRDLTRARLKMVTPWCKLQITSIKGITVVVAVGKGSR